MPLLKERGHLKEIFCRMKPKSKTNIWTHSNKKAMLDVRLICTLIYYFWTCAFHHINIFYKKLKYGIKPNFSKDWIKPPLVIFFAFLKKILDDKIKCKLSKSRTKWTGLESCGAKTTKTFGWYIFGFYSPTDAMQ